jgi:hypothetical protein
MLPGGFSYKPHLFKKCRPIHRYSSQLTGGRLSMVDSVMQVDETTIIIRRSESQSTGIRSAKTIIRTKMFNFAELPVATYASYL